MLSSAQLDAFRQSGYLTVARVFTLQQIHDAISDASSWGREFRSHLKETEIDWYLEGGSADAPLRKLDNPVFHRSVFRKLACHRPLVAMVEQLIGSGVHVVFSQIFFKPPRVGSPKPLHQDNYYFGPSDPDRLLTAWIALDEATEHNGCLRYVAGSHRGNVADHTAPPEEPFNLQVSDASQLPAPVAAPVEQGGVSLHHGNTLHQSAPNKSELWRRAVAIHYLQNDCRLLNPALKYDDAIRVAIT